MPAKAAIIYDVQNGWAIGESKGPRNIGEGYLDLILRIYEGFWRRGIPVDLVNMDAPLDGYRFVAAPMLYMLRGDIAQRLRRFAEQGGTLLTSYLTGLVDETDLCYLGQTPACGLTEVLGLWAEEIDGLWDHQHNGIVMQDTPGMQNRYEASRLCEVVHPTTAETLGIYESDYYQGMPAVTVNRFGKGRVYYVGTFGESQFYYDLLGRIAPEAGLSPALDTELPTGSPWASGKVIRKPITSCRISTRIPGSWYCPSPWRIWKPEGSTPVPSPWQATGAWSAPGQRRHSHAHHL